HEGRARAVRTKLLLVLGGFVALAALGYGGWAWSYAIHYVSTDDAYVEGTISPVSAKVAGHVAAVLIGDNQAVKQDDLLLRIDPRDHQAKVEQARAAVATAEANLRAARSEVPLTREGTRAAIEQVRANLQGALVAVRGSESAVAEARARLEARRAAADAMRADVVGAQSAQRQAGRELERLRQLLKSELVARRDFDPAEATHETGGEGRPGARGAPAEVHGGARADRRGRLEALGRGGAGGPDGPAAPGDRPAPRRLGARELQGDPGRPHPTGHARRDQGGRPSRPRLHGRRQLAERGYRGPLLAAATGERDRELGEGRPARPGEDRARLARGREPAHATRRDVGHRNDPREVTGAVE